MKSGKRPNSSRNNDKDKDRQKSKILKVLKDNFNGISTTSELAETVDLSWNTAEKYMLELTIDGKVHRIKKAGVNLWILKNDGDDSGVIRIES